MIRKLIGIQTVCAVILLIAVRIPITTLPLRPAINAFADGFCTIFVNPLAQTNYNWSFPAESLFCFLAGAVGVVVGVLAWIGLLVSLLGFLSWCFAPRPKAAEAPRYECDLCDCSVEATLIPMDFHADGTLREREELDGADVHLCQACARVLANIAQSPTTK